MSDAVAAVVSPHGAFLILFLLLLTYIGLRIGRMYNFATMTIASGFICGLLPSLWTILVIAILPVYAFIFAHLEMPPLLVSPDFFIFNSELAAIGAVLGAAMSGMRYVMGRL